MLTEGFHRQLNNILKIILFTSIISIKKILKYAIVAYVIFCIGVNFSYDKIFNDMINGDKLLFRTYSELYYDSDGFEKSSDEQYVVFLDGNEINFLLITDMFIAPFELARIPKVEYKCIYDISNPTNSTATVEGTTYNLSDNIGSEGIIIKGSILSSRAGNPQKNTFYFEYYNNNFTIQGVNDLTVEI